MSFYGISISYQQPQGLNLCPNMNRVVAAFNAFDLAVLIESQPLDLDLNVHDQLFKPWLTLRLTELQLRSRLLCSSSELSFLIAKGFIDFG